MYEFDQDTRVTEVAPGRYQGTLTSRWDIGVVPNGGYVLSIGMAALRQALPSPDPLTVTGHYLRPAVHGPVTVEVEIVKTGRQFSTAMARILQEGKERVRALATYGDLDRLTGPTYIAGEPPPVPPRDDLTPDRRAGAPEITRRFEVRTNTFDFFSGRRSSRAEVAGWLRFADGRPPDVHALALIADAFPPPAFHVLELGWIPTLELTVHVRARPASQWLRCMFRSRFIFGGLLEEDGEVWDESGTLVALSRQLAGAPR